LETRVISQKILVILLLHYIINKFPDMSMNNTSLIKLKVVLNWYLFLLNNQYLLEKISNGAWFPLAKPGGTIIFALAMVIFWIYI